MSKSVSKAFLEEPTLPGRIRGFLKQEEIAQMEMAKVLEVAQQTIHCWCKGLNVPSTANMYNIAKFMDINIYDLLPADMADLWESGS